MLHRRSTTRVALGPRRRPTAPISARRRGHRAQSAARVHTATRPRRDRIDKTPKTTSPRRNPSPTPCARRTRRAASRPRASRHRPRSLRGRTSRAHASSIIRFHRVSSRERDGRRGRGRGRARRARRIDRSIAVVAGRGADAPYPRAEARWERCVADRRILAPRRRRAPRAEDMVTRRDGREVRGEGSRGVEARRRAGRAGRGRNARAREESDGARAMVTRDARVDAL